MLPENWLKFAPAIYDKDLDHHVAALFDLAPKALWQKRYKALSAGYSDSKALKSFMVERFPVETEAHQLATTLQTHGKIIGKHRPTTTVARYRFLLFAHMVGHLKQNLGPAGQKNLAGRLRDGVLSQPTGIAPLAAELDLARHMMVSGFEIFFHDLERGGGFDLLARNGDLTLELESKTVSGDVGKKIHVGEAHKIWTGMHENLQRKRYPDGMHFLRIVVADRFPKAQAAAIISDTVTAVLGRSAIAREHFKIEYADISQDRDALNRGMVGLNRESWWRKYLEDRHGVHEHALGIQISTDSFLMAVIESDQPDNVAEGIYGQLRAGMVDQLTGTRPGIVHAHLLDITRPQLESLQAAGSALDAIANRLMNRSEKRPLGVMYSATSQAISRDDRGDGVRLSLPGLSYSFVDPAHPLAEDPRVKAAFGSEIPWDERTSRPVA